MKYMIFLTVFVLLFVGIAQGGAFSVNSLKDQFGLYFDTLSFVAQETTMLKKADSVNFIETGRRFYRFPKIQGSRGYFAEMPCVAFYQLWTYEDGLYEDPHKLIFYNHCSSTIYRYGGSIGDFNSVFKPYISDIYNFESAMKIIDLFLTTQYVIMTPKILWAPKDIEIIYDKVFGDITLSEDSSFFMQIEDEKKKVVATIKPLKYENKGQTKIIDFYTFGGPCRVEHWIFRLSQDSLYLDKRETIFDRLTGCE